MRAKWRGSRLAVAASKPMGPQTDQKFTPNFHAVQHKHANSKVQTMISSHTILILANIHHHSSRPLSFQATTAENRLISARTRSAFVRRPLNPQRSFHHIWIEPQRRIPRKRKEMIELKCIFSVNRKFGAADRGNYCKCFE